MGASTSSAHNDTRSGCDGSSGPSAANSLFFLLPPCIILLAIDIAIRNSHRLKNALPAIAAPTEDEKDLVPTPSSSSSSSILADPDSPLRPLASKAQQILTDFRQVERQLRLDAKKREKRRVSSNDSGSDRTDDEVSRECRHGLSMEIRRCRTLARSYSDSALQNSVQSPQSAGAQSKREKRGSAAISPAFTGFCERLLQANKVWKQDKEIKTLKRSVKVSKEARGSAAFKNFCDELLLSNVLWKKQREIDDLKEERERTEKMRVGVVTRAAKQVVLDVQKERLVEEFVKDILEEAAESREALKNAKEAHEREVREMVSEWRKEQRKTRREMEQLKLAQEAKTLELEISNELEDRLFDSIHEARRIASQDEEDEEGQEIEYGYGSDADTYLEEMSMMSSSSTYVGTPSPSPSKRGHFRMSETGSPSPRRKVDPSQFVGFSFNPLFFGPSKLGNEDESSRVLASSYYQDSLSKLPHSRIRATSIPGPISPLRARKDSAPTRPTPLKNVWRV